MGSAEEKEPASAPPQHDPSQLLAIVAAHAPIAVWLVGRQGNITFSEGRALKALGLQPGEALGRSVFERFRDRPEIVRHYQRAFTGEDLRAAVEVPGGVFNTWYVPLRGPSGEVEEVLVVATDLTELKRAEAKARDSGEKYRSLVENAVYGIYRSAADGGFLAVNPALVEMLGYASAQELLALDLERDLYVEPGERARLIAQYRDADRIDGVEVRWRKKDGTPITVHLSGRPVRREDNELLGFDMIIEDVTARRLLESQLRQAQKMEAVGQLTGGIAHDFNNILTTVLVNAELVRNALGSEQAEERALLDELAQTVRRGTDMIRKLLAFSRSKELAVGAVNFSQLVRDAAPTLRRLLPESIEVHLALDETLTPIHADPDAVYQILLNLATNA